MRPGLEGLHPNALRLLEKREAFNNGEPEEIGALFAADAVWHATGKGRWSGDFHGPDVGRWFVAMQDLMGGTCVVTMTDVLSDEEYVVFYLRVTGQRGDRVLDQVHVNAWRFEDGLCVEGWFLAEDVAAWDAFTS